MSGRGAGVAAILLLATAGGALACGGEPTPKNLVARPALKSTLRSTYLAAHPGLRQRIVAGPVRGRTYYGSIMGDLYAVASFTVAGHDTRPVILARHTNDHGRWHVVRETRGGICARYIPSPLLRAWSLHPVRHQPECFTEA